MIEAHDFVCVFVVLLGCLVFYGIYVLGRMTVEIGTIEMLACEMCLVHAYREEEQALMWLQRSADKGSVCFGCCSTRLVVFVTHLSLEYS